MFSLYTVETLFQLSHFVDVGLHQRALVILVDLLDDKLRVAPDDEHLDSEVRRDPKTGKQPFILCRIVCRLLPGEVHLDHVLEVLSGGGDKQYASRDTL